MVTYTSSLPEKTIEQLSEMAKKLKVPKNELINRALVLYLEALERQQYIHSFKKLAGDREVLSLAEEGIADYLKDIKGYEAK